MKFRLFYTALFLFACYALFRPESWHFPHRLPDADKLAHFVLFLLLSCTGYFVFRPGTQPVYYQLPLLFLAVFSESYQGFFLPHRQFSAGDLSANLAGIFFGFLFCLWLRDRFWRLSC